MDKQAKRAAKKRRQREKKREAKEKALAEGKDPADDILDEEDEKAIGVDGTSPDLPKPLVTSK